MSTNKEEPWGPGQYRAEVWEGGTVTWPVGSMMLRGEAEPRVGDMIVLFFSKSGCQEPGIYGWGVLTSVIGSTKRRRIKFIPAAPSDFLKMSVCWDGEIESLVNEIRGKVKQKTMWAIKPKK